MEKGELSKKKHLSPEIAMRTTPTPPVTLKRRILSAGIIPVYIQDDQRFYLLLRAYSYWDFPKGCAMLGEAPLQTARREFQEETQIEHVSFPWGESFRETPPYSQGKVARYYIGKVDSQTVQLLPNPTHGLVEHHEYRWVTYEKACELVSHRVRPILEWAEETISEAL